jgi:hypothetical protein
MAGEFCQMENYFKSNRNKTAVAPAAGSDDPYGVHEAAAKLDITRLNAIPKEAIEKVAHSGRIPVAVLRGLLQGRCVLLIASACAAPQRRLEVVNFLVDHERNLDGAALVFAAWCRHGHLSTRLLDTYPGRVGWYLLLSCLVLVYSAFALDQ